MIEPSSPPARSLLFAALGLLAVLSAGCGGSDAETARARLFHPFVERVQPADFFAAELLFGDPFSRTHDVVFLRTDSGKPVSALALRFEAAGCSATFVSRGADDAWQTFRAPLDESVARQVARAVELRLNHNITLSHTRRQTTRDGDLWIIHRNAAGGMAAALVTFEASYGNAVATSFSDDLLGTLQRFAITGGADRNALLTDLDRIATEIILSDPNP